jgi:hypothetical protein
MILLVMIEKAQIQFLNFFNFAHKQNKAMQEILKIYLINFKFLSLQN